MARLQSTGDTRPLAILSCLLVKAELLRGRCLPRALLSVVDMLRRRRLC